MTQKLFFSGNTLQQALLAAARHFQMAPEEIAFQPREKRHGFVRISGKVVIEVDALAPRRSAPAADPRPDPAPVAAVATPSLPRSDLPVTETAREALHELLSLGALELEATIREGAEGLDIELDGPDVDLVLADNGELLQALEHLLRRALRAELGESPRCRLDARGFRRSHEARLEEMARAAAEEVRRSGAPRRLPRMNPADRRLIHVTLAEEPGVSTESEGEGVFKTVVVHPA